VNLTKSHLIDAIAEQNGFTKIKSSETVETILELIKSELASGQDVLISGFGKFCVKEKQERKGRNPAILTGWENTWRRRDRNWLTVSAILIKPILQRFEVTKLFA
jgi:integration host factor subunit alpha